MHDPLISICIPAFNAKRFLSDALDSARAQSFCDWELVVVEDGSDDGTEGLVRGFDQAVSQAVRFVRHIKNQGLPATRNSCIASARAPWVALLDADDVWLPDHLNSLVRCAMTTGADLVHSGVDLFDSETGDVFERRLPDAKAIQEYPRSLFLGEYVIQPSSVMMKRICCRKIGGFDPACRYVEDREFWLRFVRGGGVVKYTGEVTCRYRQHSGAMSRNLIEMAIGVAEVYERNIDWADMPSDLRRRSAAEGWCSAGRIILRRDPWRARGLFGRALRHDTYSIRLLSYWLFALLLAFTKTK